MSVMLTLRITGALLALAALAGCSSPDSPAAAGSDDRTAKLHDAAECLRQHGVGHFADPVLGANGQVFTDTRALEEKEPDTTVSTAMTACRDKINAANWNPEQVPPAPAALVAAGVESARCLRSHGLPNVKDPTASSVYTPGHGFGLRADELPPGADKRSPIIRQALDACRSILDAEAAASSLDQLAGK
jgi:hypothetical protein